MLEWFLVHFEYPVEDGVITAIMTHAQRSSDSVLARLAIKIREKSFSIRVRLAETNSETSPYVISDDCVDEDPACNAIGSNGVPIWDYASALMIAVIRF